MKLIDPSVELILERNPFIKIELAGRTCYKSESKITENSAKNFYRGLVKRHHTAMLEHATFVFEVSRSFYEDFFKGSVPAFLNLTFNPKVNRYLVSGNLRALNESGNMYILKALYDIYPDLVYKENAVLPQELPEDIWAKHIHNVFSLWDLDTDEVGSHAYFTFRIVCDRGVTHEIVRHRVASYAQESTRYCNYSKDQFGGEITYIKPAEYSSWSEELKIYFERSLELCENNYLLMLKLGATPQQARAVLPNALKTEIIMTANMAEFEHFFNLRSRGTTGKPHPDMKVVADMMLKDYKREVLLHKADFLVNNVKYGRA